VNSDIEDIGVIRKIAKNALPVIESGEPLLRGIKKFGRCGESAF